MKRYERLEAWQAAHQLVLLTYRVTKTFPREELYGLTSQARRAAFAVAANIAEGSAKRGPREFRRYLDISVGSLSELSYIFHLVKDLELIEARPVTQGAAEVLLPISYSCGGSAPSRFRTK